MVPRLSILLLSLLAAQTVLAQKFTLEQTGDTELIFSSENRVLFAHPNGDLFVGTVDGRGCGDYCGTDGKVYRSLDGGKTWERTAYTGDGVTSFAAWPNGDVVLGSLERLFRSNDGGATWTEIATPDPWGWTHALHVAGDSVIYLGLGGVPEIHGADGIKAGIS